MNDSRLHIMPPRLPSGRFPWTQPRVNSFMHANTASIPDPRFTTNYSSDYKGVLFHRQNTLRLPQTVYETWCEPGYQPKRPDKGWKLTINDYPFDNMYYGGSLWPSVVYTPFKSENTYEEGSTTL